MPKIRLVGSVFLFCDCVDERDLLGKGTEHKGSHISPGWPPLQYAAKNDLEIMTLLPLCTTCLVMCDVRIKPRAS